jgi:signal transduction histidine kinase
VSEVRRIEADRERLLSELECKNKELESIVYVASHDLRSPLINIQGFGMRLEKDCAEMAGKARAAASGDPHALGGIEVLAGERIPRSLEFIRSSSRKMDKLIAGLLRLSRTGRVELSSEVLDMGRILGDVVASMDFLLEKEGASIEIGKLPPCRGDAEQVGQVFANLIENAIKYRAEDRPLRIVVEGERKRGEIEYVVAGTGIGIAPEQLEKIWELFYRLDPNDKAGGDGLGLSLVRRIVDRHGGRTWAKSEIGAGSRFFVTLPAADGGGSDE